MLSLSHARHGHLDVLVLSSTRTVYVITVSVSRKLHHLEFQAHDTIGHHRVLTAESVQGGARFRFQAHDVSATANFLLGLRKHCSVPVASRITHVSASNCHVQKDSWNRNSNVHEIRKCHGRYLASHLTRVMLTLDMPASAHINSSWS